MARRAVHSNTLRHIALTALHTLLAELGEKSSAGEDGQKNLIPCFNPLQV